MELHKAQIDNVSKGSSGGVSGGLSPQAIPLAQLLKNPQALNALSSLTGLQGLSSLTSLLDPDSQDLGRGKGYKLRSQGPHASNGTPNKENKRSKFAPY